MVISLASTSFVILQGQNAELAVMESGVLSCVPQVLITLSNNVKSYP